MGALYKQHLVPFGEYVPSNVCVHLPDVDFTAGETSTLFELPGKAPFSVLICFEDTIGALARKAVQGGARWLINQTNDAWFDPSSQSEQHLRIQFFGVWRIGCRWCGLLGVTAIIDSFGRVNRRLASKKRVFSGNDLPRSVEKQTQYTKSGVVLRKQ